MPNNYRILSLLILLFAFANSFAQEQILYKQIDSTKLLLEVYYPEKLDTKQAYPSIVFFAGGGWKNIARLQFQKHAKYFSGRGMICFLADYRVESKNKTSPFESLKDAKSAIRFIRENASKFHVDTSRIVASGGSAGGHLAAAAALIENYNENTDNILTSCVPNVLVLFNPVFDNGPGGYGYDRIGSEYKDFSPLHNIQKGAPPTIIFLGTKDNLVPVATAEYYKTVMGKVGSRCDLVLFDGEGHGFFNYKYFENFKKTIVEADRFLQSIGYLKEEPFVEIE